jgi:hypothetical protein
MNCGGAGRRIRKDRVLSAVRDREASRKLTSTLKAGCRAFGVLFNEAAFVLMGEEISEAGTGAHRMSQET